MGDGESKSKDLLFLLQKAGKSCAKYKNAQNLKKY